LATAARLKKDATPIPHTVAILNQSTSLNIDFFHSCPTYNPGY
jgi:hypothetical protein